MSAAFPTKFGVEGAEPVHVGVASDYPSLYAEASAQVDAEGASAQAEEASNYSTAELPSVEDPAVIEVPASASDELSEPTAEAVEPMAEQGFDQPAADATSSGWSAEEAPLEEHETTVLLREEMQQQFAQHAEPEAKPDAVPASDDSTQKFGSSEDTPDEQLAAAMAAAVGSMEPAVTEALAGTVGESTMPIDQNTSVIADIVHRVTERMRSTLITEISKELEEIRKKK